jgi:hypothetical protein
MVRNLYDAVSTHDFSEDICFLCGYELTVDNRTDEHIFPKWLLHEFDLWDQTLTLLNGTRIPYRRLVIPCCTTCNNEHLSTIEDEVKNKFSVGAKELQSMNRKTLMLWVMKIFYGLLYREIFLSFDRKNPDTGSILTADDMEQYRLLHYMLQATRTPIKFDSSESDIPCSLFVFEVKNPDNKAIRFDYKDDIIHRSLYLRMGHIGILVAFDMGAQNHEGALFFPKYQDKQLHPIQFAELGAYLFIKSQKFRRTPKVMFSEVPKEITFTVTPIAGMSMAPVFDDIEPEELAEAKMFFLNYPKEAVMPAEGKGLVATWLHSKDGSFWEMKMDKEPWVTAN